jgi:two-component system cell cycle response regulator CpdR
MDRVLILDDDAQLLTIIKESLKRYQNKFQIITAKDGLAAIKALQKGHFSVLVTEIQVPIVNGLVLLAYMAKNYPNTPCIIMTGHGTPLLRERLRQQTSHYIEKPFEIAELAQAIMSVLSENEIVRGTLNGVSVVGFLNLIEMEYLTCLCEITSPDRAKGYLFFHRGILFNAFYGNLMGEKAVLKLLQMNNVTIKFRKPPRKQIPKVIQTDLSALVTEAMRTEDETESSERKRVAAWQNQAGQ